MIKSLFQNSLNKNNTSQKINKKISKKNIHSFPKLVIINNQDLQNL